MIGTLKFGAMAVPYLVIEGVYYLSISPICNALSINYAKNAKYVKQTFSAIEEDGKVFIPFVYLNIWLFRLDTSNYAETVLKEFRTFVGDFYVFANKAFFDNNYLLAKMQANYVEMKLLEGQLNFLQEQKKLEDETLLQDISIAKAEIKLLQKEYDILRKKAKEEENKNL